MPRFRGLGYGPNHVRAGYVGHGGRGRGFMRGRAGIFLSRASPLAIRGPPDGGYEQFENSIDPIEDSKEEHGVLPDPIASSGASQQAQNCAHRMENKAMAEQQEHVAPPNPIAPPGISQQVQNSANRVENRSSSGPGVLPLSPPESPYSSNSPSYSSSSSSSSSSFYSFGSDVHGEEDVSDSSTSSDSSTESGSSETETAVDE